MPEPSHIGRKRLLDRIHRVEGQVHGIERMVRDDRGCVELLTQLAAVKNAVNQAANLVLQDHFASCLNGENSRRRDAAAGLDEIARVLDKFIR